MIPKIVSARSPFLNLAPDVQCILVSGLTLDIIKPAIIRPDTKLPVAVVSTSGSRLFFSDPLTLHTSGSSEVRISTRRTTLQRAVISLAFSPTGGFQFGGTEKNNGVPIVLRSLELREPIIFVVMNYR